MKRITFKRDNYSNSWLTLRWLLPLLAVFTLFMSFVNFNYIRPVKASEEGLKQVIEEKQKEVDKLTEILNQPVTIEEKAYVKKVKDKTMVIALTTFGVDHLDEFEELINRESGFNPHAINRSSGACGIFQALPCSKMGGMEVDNQINWGMKYIKSRYGNPTKALAFWKEKKATTGKGWY